MSDVREIMARAIYTCFPYSGKGDKPEWVVNGNSLKQDEARFYASAVRAALKAQGYEIVPREATHEMADVGVEARWRSPVRDADNVREIYRAMIAAATSPDASRSQEEAPQPVSPSPVPQPEPQD